MSCGGNGEQVQSFLHSRNDRSMLRLCALLWILKIQEDDYTRRRMILQQRSDNNDDSVLDTTNDEMCGLHDTKLEVIHGLHDAKLEVIHSVLDYTANRAPDKMRIRVNYAWK
jgi:hypothetical protein